MEMAEGRDQAEALLDRPYNFAVIDLALRGDHDEEGVDLIRSLHSRQPLCGIIALTDNRYNDPGVRAMRAGATYFINCNWRDVHWQQSLEENLTILKELGEDSPED